MSPAALGRFGWNLWKEPARRKDDFSAPGHLSTGRRALWVRNASPNPAAADKLELCFRGGSCFDDEFEYLTVGQLLPPTGESAGFGFASMPLQLEKA